MPLIDLLLLSSNDIQLGIAANLDSPCLDVKIAAVPPTTQKI
jgi:hypothetical protein